jgi:hypothetical protein
MIDQMRHLLSSDDSMVGADYKMPSLLQDVPSFTSDHACAPLGESKHAELGRRIRGN